MAGGSFHELKFLSWYITLDPLSTRQFPPKTIERWFAQATHIVALAWASNARYRIYFDPARPLLQLSARALNDVHLVGKIGPVVGDHLQLACDFRQVSPATNGDIYRSTKYPCRKYTQKIAGKATKWSQTPRINGLPYS
jgi:hypothetical protein